MSGVASFPQILVSSRSTGSAKASFTTAATILDPMEVLPLPANYISRDTIWRVELFGALGATAAPTFTFQWMLGSVAIWSSGALTAAAGTALPFFLELNLRCAVEGSGTTANMIGVGRITSAALANTTACVPVATPAAGTGFDSTAAASLDFHVACSASSASNTVQKFDYRVLQYRFGS